jgi:hypothetical protein
MISNHQTRMDHQRAFWQKGNHDCSDISFTGIAHQPHDARQAPCQDSAL